MSEYNLSSLDLPKLTGVALKVFTEAVENPASRFVLIGSLLENGGLPKLRKIFLNESPTFYPLVAPKEAGSAIPKPWEAGSPPMGFPYRTARDYTGAYSKGDLTPLEAAENVLKAIRDSENGNRPLHAFMPIEQEDVLTQARAAGERYRTGQTLGPLDGVPTAIKDEVDMQPYPTRVGTRFLGTSPAAQDSTVVARLRAAGALLVGKTNMHEIGINPNGGNANYGAVRNPFDDQNDPGGSSSGSAAAVAAGLVPTAAVPFASLPGYVEL